MNASRFTAWAPPTPITLADKGRARIHDKPATQACLANAANNVAAQFTGAADRETFARAPSWSSRAGLMQVVITTATAPNDKIEKGRAQAKVCPHHPNDRDRQIVTDMNSRS